MALYLLEFYVSHEDGAAVRRGAQRARRSAAQLSREGTPVRWLRSVFVPEDETCLFFYEAESAGAVREAALRAKLPPERVVEALAEPKGEA